MRGIIATLGAMLATGPALAEGHVSRVQQLLEIAEAECRADVMALDPEGPVPDLEVRPAAITWVDLDGDWEKDDAVVDFNHVYCSLNYSLWHGTGGSLVHLVIDDRVSSAWSGGRWQLISFGETPLLLLGRHGGYCDGFGAQPCIQAIAYADDSFSTVVLEAGPLDWPEGPDQ